MMNLTLRLEETFKRKSHNEQKFPTHMTDRGLAYQYTEFHTTKKHF